MINAAHASRFFWDAVGGPLQHARGEWQIARVCAVVGRAEPALHHAQRCHELCVQHQLRGLDLAYGYEALARAHAVAGNDEMATAYAAKARQVAMEISETEDRHLVLHDLDSL